MTVQKHCCDEYEWDMSAWICFHLTRGMTHCQRRCSSRIDWVTQTKVNGRSILCKEIFCLILSDNLDKIIPLSQSTGFPNKLPRNSPESKLVHFRVVISFWLVYHTIKIFTFLHKRLNTKSNKTAGK